MGNFFGTRSAADNYDGRSNIWRVQYAYGTNLYDIKSSYHFAYGAYDVAQCLYDLNTKPSPGGFKNGAEEGAKWFTPKGLARGGVR